MTFYRHSVYFAIKAAAVYFIVTTSGSVMSHHIIDSSHPLDRIFSLVIILAVIFHQVLGMISRVSITNVMGEFMPWNNVNSNKWYVLYTKMMQIYSDVIDESNERNKTNIPYNNAQDAENILKKHSFLLNYLRNETQWIDNPRVKNKILSLIKSANKDLNDSIDVLATVAHYTTANSPKEKELSFNDNFFRFLFTFEARARTQKVMTTNITEDLFISITNVVSIYHLMREVIENQDKPSFDPDLILKQLDIIIY